MQVLVTGGAGFIGTNLIKKLLSDGYKVECLDNYSTGKRENVLEGCKYIEVDISDSLRRHKGFGLETYQSPFRNRLYKITFYQFVDFCANIIVITNLLSTLL